MTSIVRSSWPGVLLAAALWACGCSLLPSYQHPAPPPPTVATSGEPRRAEGLLQQAAYVEAAPAARPREARPDEPKGKGAARKEPGGDREPDELPMPAAAGKPQATDRLPIDLTTAFRLAHPLQPAPVREDDGS